MIKKLLLTLCVFMLTFFMTESCQKTGANPVTPPNPVIPPDPVIKDSTATETGMNYKQLVNTFWIDSRDVGVYNLGFRFSSDSSVTYSFMGYVYPIRYDSVFYYWNFVKPNTLTIFEDTQHNGWIGTFTIYSLTDSLIRCHISAFPDTTSLWRVF